MGELFVSYGDNTNPFTAGDYAPIDPTPGKFLADALRSSANTKDLRGKILRIRPIQNGTYAIPDGNLFADPKDGRPEIYTMGHRNPVPHQRRPAHRLAVLGRGRPGRARRTRSSAPRATTR